MGLMDSVKNMFSGKKGAETKVEAEQIARQVDAEAQKLAAKDGTVGDVAEKVHEVADKVDGD